MVQNKLKGWGVGRKRKYHFDKLRVGSTVFYAGATMSNVNSACYAYRRKYAPGTQFTMRSEVDGPDGTGIRVMRTN